jgi:hypothetical protein
MGRAVRWWISLNSPFCAQHSRSAADGRRNSEADVQVTGRDRLLWGIRGERGEDICLYISVPANLLKLLGYKIHCSPRVKFKGLDGAAYRGRMKDGFASVFSLEKRILWT